MFYKITFFNGYCGCDETIYIKTELNGEDLENYAEDYLTSGNYSPYWDASQCMDDDPDDYDSIDDYYEAMDAYQAECGYDIEECSEKEYLDYSGFEVE